MRSAGLNAEWSSRLAMQAVPALTCDAHCTARAVWEVRTPHTARKTVNYKRVELLYSDTALQINSPVLLVEYMFKLPARTQYNYRLLAISLKHGNVAKKWCKPRPVNVCQKQVH